LPSPAANPYDFGSAHIFGHYASRTLSPDDVVVATNTAPNPRMDAAYNEVRQVLRDDALALLIGGAATPVRIGELMTGLGERVERAWFRLLWLIKYDLLRAVPSGRTRRPSGRCCARASAPDASRRGSARRRRSRPRDRARAPARCPRPPAA